MSLKNLLFRAQSFHRIQPRSFRRRICAKEKSDAQRHQQASQHRPELHRRRQRSRQVNKFSDHDTAQNADGSANHGNGPRLNQELQQDVAAPRAQRLAHTDLSGALRNTDHIMFMITMPPTTSEIEAMAIVTTKNDELMSFHNERKESLVSMAKSSFAL